MENSIGLWEKTSQKGNKYYSGKVEIDGKEYIISLFTVDKSNNAKRPDYNMILKEVQPKKENDKASDDVYANFGNQVNTISDEDIAF